MISFHAARSAVVLRWSKGGWRVVPRRLPSGQHHTFVSHKWSSGQDKARSVKALLQHLVPGLKVWLDVDNLRSEAGATSLDSESFEQLLDEQHSLIAFLTGSTLSNGKAVSDYFRSTACLVEIRRAHHNGVPIIFLLEADPTHGGVPLEAHRRDCPDDLLPLLDSSPLVHWHRTQAFQDISLRLLARYVLCREAAEHKVRRDEQGVYHPREVPRTPVELASPEAPPAVGKRFHIYASANNPGAAELALELQSHAAEYSTGHALVISTKPDEGEASLLAMQSQHFLLSGLRSVVSDPFTETVEFIRRDVLNLAMRNTGVIVLEKQFLLLLRSVPPRVRTLAPRP